VVPLEVSGVVGVSATGPSEQDTHAGQYVDNLKSFYSSYGVSAVDVTAPGGDSIFNDFDPPVQGRVLSTWPSSAPAAANCLPERRRDDPAGVTGGDPGVRCMRAHTTRAERGNGAGRGEGALRDAVR